MQSISDISTSLGTTVKLLRDILKLYKKKDLEGVGFKIVDINKVLSPFVDRFSDIKEINRRVESLRMRVDCEKIKSRKDEEDIKKCYNPCTGMYITNLGYSTNLMIEDIIGDVSILSRRKYWFENVRK